MELLCDLLLLLDAAMDERRVKPLLFGAEVVRFFGLGFFSPVIAFDFEEEEEEEEEMEDEDEDEEATPFLPMSEVRRVSVLPPVREGPEMRLVDFRIMNASTNSAAQYKMWI